MFIKKDLFIHCIAYEDGDIRKAISTIEKGGLRIALIINRNYKLIGTICDGDIRRGLLKGLTLDSPLSKIIQKNYIGMYPCLSRRADATDTPITMHRNAAPPPAMRQ